MYEERKKTLEALQEELGKRFESLQKDYTRAHNRDSGEQAVERENDDVVAELREETQQELSQVQRALKKIEMGTYGQCEQCGKPIKSERLDALPFSTLCIACASGD